jgi:hypothetical protein
VMKYGYMYTTPNKICIVLQSVVQTVVPSEGRDEPSRSLRLAMFLCPFVSSSCRPNTEPRNVEDSDAFSVRGPGAVGGGADALTSATIAESSSQLLISLAIRDRTQGKVMAAQMPAHRNGTPHPKILLATEQRR